MQNFPNIFGRFFLSFLDPDPNFSGFESSDFRYIRPSNIPEHDDVKLRSISSDADSFMRRMVALIPTQVGIRKHINRFFCGKFNFFSFIFSLFFFNGERLNRFAHFFCARNSITIIFFLADNIGYVIILALHKGHDVSTPDYAILVFESDQ